uniref:Uncharacterized protein n=1 Tax=Brassica campestris TaxID=3711 RepID=M4CFH7_BRACM
MSDFRKFLKRFVLVAQRRREARDYEEESAAEATNTDFGEGEIASVHSAGLTNMLHNVGTLESFTCLNGDHFN